MTVSCTGISLLMQLCIFCMCLHFLQKSSLIIPNLIMITCYHDNSLIGPIAHLSLFLSLSLSLAVFLLLVSIFFVVTPTHPSATAITYFNFLTEDSTFFVYLIFFFTLLSFFPLLFLFMRYLQLWENQSHFLLLASPASTVPASGRVPLQQTWRGHSSVSARFFGGFSNLPDLRLEQFGQALYAVCVKVKNFKVFCEPQWR